MTKDTPKEKAQKNAEIILSLLNDFCTQKLDKEYTQPSKELTRKLLRKRSHPLATGKPNIWAAAIIHALGSTNFLFDKSFEPYVSADDLNKFFGTSKSTVSSKSGTIKDMFDMGYFGGNFETKRMSEANPFNAMVMMDDMIYPLSALPEDIQQQVKEARAKGISC